MPTTQHSEKTLPYLEPAAKPSRNYLQSPYFFMCCTLWDVNEERAVESDSGSSLAGTVVSSLHRLKDVDNTGELSRIRISFG
jgi:hypothetical protein